MIEYPVSVRVLHVHEAQSVAAFVKDIGPFTAAAQLQRGLSALLIQTGSNYT